VRIEIFNGVNNYVFDYTGEDLNPHPERVPKYGFFIISANPILRLCILSNIICFSVSVRKRFLSFSFFLKNKIVSSLILGYGKSHISPKKSYN
jgi:hypothetical protein